MNKRVTAIVEEAKKLTRRERLELFDRLEAEFLGDEGDGTPEEVEAAWMQEVQRRIAKAERGETTFVDFDLALEKASRFVRKP
jgi:hypothetical protein